MIPKFRVWDKKRSEMINLISINFHKYIQMDDLTCSCEDGPITRNFQDVILMQSTGLHDKNGVEIFEGDVVNLNHTFRNPMTGSGTLTLNKNFEVIFVNGMFTREGTSMGLNKDLKYITVIGNVWENP